MFIVPAWYFWAKKFLNRANHMSFDAISRQICVSFCVFGNGPLTRYATLRVAHASRMPGSLSPSPTWKENVPGISGACANRNFAYLVRGPCFSPRCGSIRSLWSRQCHSGPKVTGDSLAEHLHRSWVQQSHPWDAGQWRKVTTCFLITIIGNPIVTAVRSSYLYNWISYTGKMHLYIFLCTNPTTFGCYENKAIIGSASGSRDFTRFGPGGSTLSRFPCKTPIGKVGTSQYTFVTKKLA